MGPPQRRQFQTPEGQTRWSENLFNEDVEEVSRRLREISVQAVWRDLGCQDGLRITCGEHPLPRNSIKHDHVLMMDLMEK